VTGLTIETPQEMEELGARLAGQLRAGDLVLLNGELAAGKTTLTRGLGAALGVRGAVTSPTFVLARTHPRRDGAPLVHVDAYRLRSALELDDLDIDFERSIVVVEWGAGLLDGITPNWLQIDIVRPTGVAAVPEALEGPPSAPERGPAPGRGPVPERGPAPEALEGPPPTPDTAQFDGPEPRTVTLTGHGERWQDLGWVGAARD
jgi:tRNA threonylcarbamoyl adenosine modification protein YjeE